MHWAETRFIETDMGWDNYAWVCERCEDARIFDYILPDEKDFNFCPKCGRRVVEFIRLEVDKP